MNTKAIVRDIGSVATSEVAHSEGAHISILLGPADEMPNFYTRMFRLEPGGSIPNHRHDSIEHEQVVLEGEMVLSLDGEERVVREGQAIYIPARVAHSYRNDGEGAVRFLCMVPAVADYQTEWL